MTESGDGMVALSFRGFTRRHFRSAPLCMHLPQLVNGLKHIESRGKLLSGVKRRIAGQPWSLWALAGLTAVRRLEISADWSTQTPLRTR